MSYHPTHDFDWRDLTGFCVNCALPSFCVASRQPRRPSTDDSPDACAEIAQEARRHA